MFEQGHLEKHGCPEFVPCIRVCTVLQQPVYRLDIIFHCKPVERRFTERVRLADKVGILREQLPGQDKIMFGQGIAENFPF